MSAGWDAALAELRAEYLAEAPGRLTRGNEALARLAGGQPEAAADLRRVFHGFAGSGRTYGFGRVSELGLEGEALADQWPPADEDGGLARAAQLLALLGQDLGGGAAPERPPDGPCAEREAGAGQPWPAPAPGQWSAGEVLVVEDDPAALQALCVALDHEGYAVRAARSLACATAELGRGLPDALVADVILPDGEVFGLVERLRERPDTEDLPVLLQSVQACCSGMPASPRACSRSRTTPSRRPSCAGCSNRPATPSAGVPSRPRWKRPWRTSSPTSC